MITQPVESICTDVATEACPCVATITKDCPVCNLLNHGEKCACNQTWPGLCVYERYLQQGIKPLPISDKITVAQKFILDHHVQLICHIPPQDIALYKPFQAVKISTNTYKHPVKLFGVVTKVIRDKNLLTLIVKDTEYESPIKFGPILQKNTNLKLTNLGYVLPPFTTDNMHNILIVVDGFWQSIVTPLIDKFKTADKQVTIMGPLSLKTTTQFSLTTADKVIPTEKFTILSEAIRKPEYDTLISINTPLWQKKVIALMWNEKINKSLITVNNEWL